MIPKTLIIGLGGLGSDVVTEVYRRFMAHTQHNDDREKVRFLALDTDSNEIAERRKIMPPHDVIQTSATTNVTVGHFIEELKDKSDVEEWFPVESKDLMLMTINDGAGQIRVVSRLAFSHAIMTGKLDRISRVIDELLNVRAGEGNIINVHIVSSLAGGTGAGSFLQTAYLVKEVLRDRGVENPTVTGYFVLGDVFLHDSSLNLSDPDKTTNILANTYASIKELNGIFNIPDNKSIPFDYGELGRHFTITAHTPKPYDRIFLYGFESNSGNNLGRLENYKKQVEEFLYLNAFSPVGGELRSQYINNIYTEMLRGPAARYGSSGISKIVYPVENLLEYFAARRLKDNLNTTWLRIDKDFDEKYREYQQNLNRGIIAEEPRIGKFFRTQVEQLAQTGTGAEQAVFRRIWNSTKMFGGESGTEELGYKAEILMEEIDRFLTDIRDKDEELNEHAYVVIPEQFLEETDYHYDLNIINNTESQLEELKREVYGFIENVKRYAVDEIFLRDISSSGYYDEQAKHRINTYVLEKDKAMHPLAQRYFFYQLLDLMQNEYDRLVEENKRLRSRIEGYEMIYDLKRDDGEDEVIESAADAYKIYSQNRRSLIAMLNRLFGRPDNLQEFKEDYRRQATEQAKRLKEYALSKLKEEVLELLIPQIKTIIDNLERMFKALPAIITEMEHRAHALAQETKDNTDTQVFVLAKPAHRDYLYENVIAARDTIFFPEDLSRTIYEQLYYHTYQQIEQPLQYRDYPENRIHNIFNDKVLKHQIGRFREDFKDDFAGFNVIQALKKQGEIEGVPSRDLTAFMKKFFTEAEFKARPYGPKYDTKDPVVNTWATHPSNLERQYLTEAEINELFGNPGASQQNAYRVVSEYFDPTEIIRENSVLVLEVPRHYPKFAPKNPHTKYTSSRDGLYYQHYKKRIKEIRTRPSLPMPHLDKRWINPAVFPDLGVSDKEYKKRIYSAFLWGITAHMLEPRIFHGTRVWTYSENMQVLRDRDGKPLRANLANILREQGLWNNEAVVDDILTRMEKKKKEAAEDWPLLRNEGRSIKTLDIVKTFTRFRFDDTFPKYTGRNILGVFDGTFSPNDDEALRYVVNEIMDTIATITGNKGEETRDIIEGIFDNLTRELPEQNDYGFDRQRVRRIIDNELERYFTQ